MKKFSKRTVRQIGAAATTALMAMSASAGMCVTTVSAAELPDAPTTMAYNEDIKYDYITRWVSRYATAYLAEDEYGNYYGEIDITDTSIWDSAEGLTSIAGCPLSEIIKTADGNGHIDSIRLEYDDDAWWYDYTIAVTGKASEGSYRKMYSDYIDLDFTDGENDTYNLTIRSSSLKEHTVWYNSNDYKITRIVWSESATTTPLGLDM